MVGGLLTLVPAIADISFTTLSTQLTSAITDSGDDGHGLWVSLLGVLAWAVVIIVPGWIWFSRGDLK